MRNLDWTPSIIALNGHDQTVYLAVEGFGRNGSAYVETDVERANLE